MIVEPRFSVEVLLQVQGFHWAFVCFEGFLLLVTSSACCAGSKVPILELRELKIDLAWIRTETEANI